MACPRCKDQFTTRTDTSARGQNKPAVLVATHLCSGCDSTFSVAGQGKAKHDVVLHKCNSCGTVALTCCSTGNSGPAPLK